jgi:hypothetical protein
MQGFSAFEFRPHIPVTPHQVGAVMTRLKLKTRNPWNDPNDWTEPALRGWVHTQLPQLTFNEERWTEPLTRLQLMLLTGRYLRGV